MKNGCSLLNARFLRAKPTVSVSHEWLSMSNFVLLQPKAVRVDDR